MHLGKIFQHESGHAEWADRHPVVSGALATGTTAALTAVFARELVDRPTAKNVLATTALGIVTAGGVIETVRPDTFRLWERLESRFNN